MVKIRSIVFLAVAALVLTSTMSAAGLVVYVGYADNLRASGFFPNPWLGSPNVVSQTPTGQSLDAGAVRIDNTGTTSVVISSFTVTLGGGEFFNIWSPLTILPGQTGIFTQTSSYNFDSSDYGLFGGGPVNVDAAHPLGGCTNPANASQVSSCLAYQPVVSFSASGTPASLLDTGHVLDTFGYDLINLGAPGGDGNESINWNLIGTVATRGGSVTPEPASAFLLAGGVCALGLIQRRSRRQRIGKTG